MSELEELARTVLHFISDATEDPESSAHDARFEKIALAVFDFQYRRNDAYRRLCERRGRTPSSVRRWQEIPAVPTSAFKEVDLACGPPEKIFLTSGTTRGSERRGRHLVPCLELYRRSALAHFRRMVLPDDAVPRLVALVGGPDLLPQSSLTQMVEWIRQEVCQGEGEYLVDASGFDPARAVARIEEVARFGRPICLVGLRVLFTALVDHCRTAKLCLELPADSRIVDTGGPKGGRALSDAGFLAAAWTVFGVPGYYCLNEYGMTELTSQYYDDVLRSRFEGSNRPRRKLPPPWLRPLAVDPDTLGPVAEGQAGILCHFDLANAGSVLAVQTEDLGVLKAGGLRLLGRLPGAEARGCALALADLLGESRP